MNPEFAIISELKHDGYTTLVIDTTKATYQGVKWLDMGAFGRRKFENFLMLTRQPERLHYKYV